MNEEEGERKTREKFLGCLRERKKEGEREVRIKMSS